TRSRVDYSAPRGEWRTVALKDFFLPPRMAQQHDTLIKRGEVLTRVIVPAPAPGTRSAYHKQTERESYDWPICDVAVVLAMDGQTVRDASIVLGWVAPTPRRAAAAEAALRGGRMTDEVARRAARAAIERATPLPKNAYK